MALWGLRLPTGPWTSTHKGIAFVALAGGPLSGGTALYLATLPKGHTAIPEIVLTRPALLSRPTCRRFVGGRFPPGPPRDAGKDNGRDRAAGRGEGFHKVPTVVTRTGEQTIPNSASGGTICGIGRRAPGGIMNCTRKWTTSFPPLARSDCAAETPGRLIGLLACARSVPTQQHGGVVWKTSFSI